MRVSVRLLSEHARVPVRGSAGAAGSDLFSAVDAVIPPGGGWALIATDLQMAFDGDGDHHYYVRIAPRSGLALRHGIDVGAGVIDQDYRGPIGVILFNHHATEPFAVKKGDRIAQMIFERISIPTFHVCDDVDTTTDRGSKGFGSTGK